jgi:signal transduction histidine kinase
LNVDRHGAGLETISMLERRGVAGCILVFFVTSLVALAAFQWDGAGGDAAVTAALASVAAIVLAAAAWFFYRRSTQRDAADPHAARRVLTLVIEDDSSLTSEEPVLEIDDLVRMLDDAILLSREPPLVPRFRAVDLTKLLSEEISMRAEPGNLPGDATPASGGGSRPLTLAGTPPPLLTLADPAALSRVFRILIANALSNGSRATLRVDRGTTALVVHVDDNGLGVPRNEREAVFQRAYHMEIAPSQRSNRCAELVIARQIARVHGGDIIVSASPEGGARFTLRLSLLLEQENALQIAS